MSMRLCTLMQSHVVSAWSLRLHMHQTHDQEQQRVLYLTKLNMVVSAAHVKLNSEQPGMLNLAGVKLIPRPSLLLF